MSDPRERLHTNQLFFRANRLEMTDTSLIRRPDPRTSTSLEQSFLDSECIHNQRCYGTMETTERCSVSNWSRIHHPRSSDCSGKWLFGGEKNRRKQAKSAPSLPTVQE